MRDSLSHTFHFIHHTQPQKNRHTHPSQSKNTQPQITYRPFFLWITTKTITITLHQKNPKKQKKSETQTHR